MKYIHMKNTLVVALFFIGAIMGVYGQEDSIGSMAAKKVGLYVFPANGQSTEQLNKDETECYQWAVKESGVDPLNPPKVVAKEVETGPDGGGVRGAARGAAAGAAIGAIAGDAGDGAAIGAIAGGLRGRRASKQTQASQQNANNQAADQTEGDMMNNFKKAFSACLQGKGYTVQ